MYLDETGVVRNKLVKTTSGHDALDAGTLLVADAMRFQPAMNRDQPTAVWVSQWLTFEPTPSAPSTSRSDRPTFIPFDTNPVLQNAGEVQRALQEAYPRDLRDAGVGGRVEIWLYIDEPGVVANQQLKTSSGVDALDRAAAEVVKVMRFEPAKNRREATAVWISQWLTFEVVGSTAREQDDGAPPADRPLKITDFVVTGVVGDVDQDGGGVLYVRPRTALDPTALDPMIVIDGVIQADDVAFSELGALDIEHVEVVKGDAAIERYGEAARNGVVHITTKKNE